MGGRIAASGWRVPTMIFASLVFAGPAAVLPNVPVAPWFLALAAALWSFGMCLRGAGLWWARRWPTPQRVNRP